MEITHTLVFQPAQCVITQLHFVIFCVLHPNHLYAYTHESIHLFMQAATGYCTTHLRMREQQLEAGEFAMVVTRHRKALHDMIDRLHYYRRCAKKDKARAVVYEQYIQRLKEVNSDIEQYWSAECSAEYVLTHVQLGEVKPLIRKRWNAVSPLLQEAAISQQLVQVLKEPVLHLLLNKSRVRPDSRQVTYLLDLMDAVEVLAGAGNMDTAALAWLLATRNFNSRSFVQYCMELLDKELNSKEALEDKLLMLRWLQQQTPYLELFSWLRLVPTALPVKEMVDNWLKLRMLECAALAAESKTERWHFAVSGAVLMMLFHVMMGTGFVKGSLSQTIQNIARWCRLANTEAPAAAYLEKEFYTKKGYAKRELLLWIDKWINFLDKM